MSSPEQDLNYKDRADSLAISQFSLHHTKNTRSNVLLFPIRYTSTVVPRLTSDPANEFFG
jgi:hypothetical protein